MVPESARSSPSPKKASAHEVAAVTFGQKVVLLYYEACGACCGSCDAVPGGDGAKGRACAIYAGAKKLCGV